MCTDTAMAMMITAIEGDEKLLLFSVPLSFGTPPARMASAA